MPKRVLQGTVVSTLNQNTLTVSVERRFKHPVLKKDISTLISECNDKENVNEFTI